MTKISFVLFIIFSVLSQFIIGQKYDNTWLMGCCSDSMYRKNGGVIIKFDKGYPDTMFVLRDADFNRTSISISNPLTGNLLFYSNGCHIYNKRDQIMDYGDEINPGINHHQWCDYGYNLPKGGVVLPDPVAITDKYYLIHRAYDDTGRTVDKMYYSIIDMSLNFGLGKVIKKNVILLDQRLYKRHFDVVKHSNNKDYWIITFNYASDTAFRFLLNDQGIDGPFTQYFPIPRDKYDDLANSTISPDGKLAVRVDPYTGLFLMNIDRSTGLFSNLRSYPFWVNPDTAVVTGISISPDSKLLYINTRTRLFQLDLESTDIAASRILIDTFDGYRDPFSASFYLSQLAPDGKIYLNCTNGIKVMHTIHQPNLRGKDCEFRQHDLILPAQNIFSMPYFPNYRLGVMTDVNQVHEKNEYFIYPNPVLDELIIKGLSENNNLRYEIQDLTGKIKLNGPYMNSINTKSLNPGLYVLKIDNGKHPVNCMKFIKLLSN